MRRLIIIINLSLIVAFMMMFADCSNSSKDKKLVSIGYVNWSEGIAMSYLAKVMLESKGYDVMLRNADIAPIFVSMAAGKVDVFMDSWLPATHADYIKKYGDNLETLGVAYKNARMGLVVPSYVTISSIEELNGHKDEFRNEIIGIDVGAGLMNETERVIQEYPVELTLKPSSGATMVAFLQKSIENKEWIVVTGWTPHWMFSRYDLKFLDDSQKQYGDAEHIQIMATKGFSEKDPYAAAFFRNFSLDNEQLSELMDLVEGNPMHEEEEVKIWLSKHPEVNEFFPTFAE
ncbi:glycine betaine ABC transporter substrate-binding protein [Parabacteroides sp. ASD2025]|jgi:glycine betaine/proline transport system substrate-binding protein|uniref:glycine betaine ABC transporter substrate-binding protein n=1 Tax=Parabacteroides sp. ASD2025 TaxID=3415987 RepID=UPI0025F4F8C3|nr:glycine betaine ABC transporter substrate-binding protein [uncultured Parabacteroides sp.]